ncbi:hypothetical protein A3A59_04540 [Candidatus Gottesmanbacteria bacterium RIFCSPLOWO2_01_FULL_42_10]|nr:MAG: hypothetical protein A2699_00880 [Candidatus Gottesmanbacteria bacterium RIFCSPHIGHO2_01_FULL_43_15]OGG24700.1 MAG: hypothetical protein A3A59_04540 [Candidatus Gottesmanbacteria bacterium RIFCSPLOWO2_01_FULL_42_10]
MEITIREIKPGDEWDGFILKNNPWSFFQSTTWIKLQEKLGVSVWHLGLFNKQKMIGLVAVYVIRAKRGTFLHVRHGPVFTSSTNIENWKILIAKLKEIASQEKAWFIRFSPMIVETPTLRNLFQKLGMFPSPIHAMDAEICWVLDITKTEEELLAEMRKTTRYLIRQAQKMGVEVDKTNGLADFQKLYIQTYERHGFVPYAGIGEEFDLFFQNNNAVSFVAKHDGLPIAAAIILFFGDFAIYHHGASIPSKIPGSYLLQWMAIKEAKKRGKKLYNFWGIAPPDKPNHPWSGITLFKQGFGGREVRFGHVQDLPLSPFYAISYTIEKLRKLKRGY